MGGGRWKQAVLSLRVRLEITATILRSLAGKRHCFPGEYCRGVQAPSLARTEDLELVEPDAAPRVVDRGAELHGGQPGRGRGPWCHSPAGRSTLYEITPNEKERPARK